MISRTWRGWTTLNNADKYDELLRITIFPGILMRDIPGRRSGPGVVRLPRWRGAASRSRDGNFLIESWVFCRNGLQNQPLGKT
jgi:hypothetical protein